MATVCPQIVIVSPTLKVFKNCVPVHVTVVHAARFVTVPTPVVAWSTWSFAIGVAVPIPTLLSTIKLPHVRRTPMALR